MFNVSPCDIRELDRKEFNGGFGFWDGFSLILGAFLCLYNRKLFIWGFEPGNTPFKYAHV